MFFPGGYGISLIDKEPQRGIKRQKTPGFKQYLKPPKSRVLVSVQGE